VPSESWTIEGSGKSILINGLIAVARSWRVEIGSAAMTREGIMLGTCQLIFLLQVGRGLTYQTKKNIKEKSYG